ncbi:MAG: tetratricopeptide repeat protein [Lentisphaeria bacterium]|jgi:tetratricopeptide (TPR) repeat protein
MKQFVLVLLLVVTTVTAGTAFGADKDAALDDFVANQQLLQDATESEKQGEYKRAAKLFRKLGDKTQSPQLKAAYQLRQADCFFAARKVRKALSLYKDLIERYPLYIPYEHVVTQLRSLAESFVDGDGTFLGLRDKTTAIETYELIIQGAPSIHVSLADRERLAELLVNERRPEEAIAVYQAILKQDAKLARIRADMALLLFDMSKRGDGDGSKMRLAVRQAEMALQQEPSQPRSRELLDLITQAKQIQAQRDLDKALFYLKPAHKSIVSARRYLNDLIREYPDTPAAQEARRILESTPELATDAIAIPASDQN